MLKEVFDHRKEIGEHFGGHERPNVGQASVFEIFAHSLQDADSGLHTAREAFFDIFLEASYVHVSGTEEVRQEREGLSTPLSEGPGIQSRVADNVWGIRLVRCENRLPFGEKSFDSAL